MSIKRSTLEQVQSLEFNNKVIYRAAKKKELEPVEYGPIDLQMDNSRRGQTVYSLVFDEDTEVSLTYHHSARNEAFRMMEAISRDVDYKEASGVLFSSDPESRLNVNEVVNDEGKLPEMYCEPLSELMHTEIWK